VHLSFFFLFLNLIVLFGLICRGPTYGHRGKVVLVFPGNEASKIGVRFDESIPEGNDLGGHCEKDRGFFCAGDLLLTCFFTA